MIKDPKPGSPEAVAEGCTCPVIDNHHGRGLPSGLFWFSEGCPVHRGYVEQDDPAEDNMSANERYNYRRGLTPDMDGYIDEDDDWDDEEDPDDLENCDEFDDEETLTEEDEVIDGR